MYFDVESVYFIFLWDSFPTLARFTLVFHRFPSSPSVLLFSILFLVVAKVIIGAWRLCRLEKHPSLYNLCACSSDNSHPDLPHAHRNRSTGQVSGKLLRGYFGAPNQLNLAVLPSQKMVEFGHEPGVSAD